MNQYACFQGGGDQGICEGDSSDVGPVFKQEAYFHWAYGVLEPDWFGALDLSTGKSVLFMPRLPAEYAVWMGKIETCAEAADRYGVDEVRYVDEMPAVLEKMSSGGGKKPTLLTLNGTNSDSSKATRPAAFDGEEIIPCQDAIRRPEKNADLFIVYSRRRGTVVAGTVYISKLQVR